MNENSEEMEIVTYDYGGEIYEIRANSETHEKIATDSEYFNKFISQASEDEVQIIERRVISKLEPTRTSDSSKNGDVIDKITEEKEFRDVWDSAKIKFLLEKYLERIDKFRDPKCKKKILWKEIQKEFEEIGYPSVSADDIDKKLRNLKITYKRIKNCKKIGKGRDGWKWFSAMDKIFSNDKSVNFDSGISSMEHDPLDIPIDFSKHTLSSPSLSFHNFLDTHNSKMLSAYVDFLSSFYNTFSESDLESSIDGNSNDQEDSDTLPSASSGDSPSKKSLMRGNRKSTSSKKLHTFRKKVVELEKKKIALLEKFDNKNPTNDIVSHLEKIADSLTKRVSARVEKQMLMKTRNELLKEKNEIMKQNNVLQQQRNDILLKTSEAINKKNELLEKLLRNKNY